MHARVDEVERGDAPRVRVKLPAMMRARVGGLASVDASGSTLREVIADLERRHPGSATGLVTEDGSLHRFVNLYLNGEDARFLGSLETEVKDGDTVSILPAVAGG